MTLNFPCPRCRALLKVRDESFVGMTLNCPECQVPLEIIKSAEGEVLARETTIAPVETSGATTSSSATPATSQTGRSRSKAKTSASPSEAEPLETSPVGDGGSKLPQIVAWGVAGLCLLVLIPFLIPSRPAAPNPLDTVAKRAIKPADNSANEPATPANQSPDTSIPTQAVAPAPLPDTAQGRLQALGNLVLEDAKKSGRFPAGSVSAPDLLLNQRWSWLAQVAARRDNPNGTVISWTQRWNDPSNESFVRRPIPRFQNPQAKAMVGEDKYPAAHFVGVAGVGVDAPTLPVDHPRAGIFGHERQTRLDQIGDGQSQTMLLAGVEDGLASWAEGPASYRPFTREPYVRGPDGFGTGEPDRMLVLMADGSVREINAQTDPRIVRRMAAMNDGLPLDEKIPGEPGDPRPTSPPGNPQLAGTPQPAGPGATVPGDATPKNAGQGNPGEGNRAAAQTPPDVLRPATPPIDIPAALSRRILKFDQSRPAAAFKLLLQIEELSGVRIEYDRATLGEEARRLDHPVTLRKENASLEELLDEILSQAKLQRKSEATSIRIVPATRG